MPEAPLEFVVVEPAGYCDPETGLCVPPAGEETPEIQAGPEAEPAEEN
jgi:hypothetical protein